ncbi:hypothetical protein BJ508DRAFT_411080 [Ascobolus immersus RN42]|uniref:Fumarylacetoacetase-like C-terminal domain-containing protein n=1 Tax=Ascobolus immersus RN42 TaxID=1160509 RepID=A0A3N4IQB3_ASCIM|nr:hypothetical protein BJ508DRAFT_411080 [Ascobolus immersus RN42]
MVTKPLATAASSALKKIPRPYQIAAIGRNYLSHIKELNNTRPAEPFFFLKAPSTILHPGEGPVQIPRDANVHYEVELGVIFGKDIDAIKENQVEGDEKRYQGTVLAGKPSKKDIAGGVIGSYFVAIDMTSRTYQDQAKKAGLPWSLGKNLKTFTPVSHIIPRSALPPFPWKSDKIRLHLSVNGQERQNDSTDLMLTKIPGLVQHVSSVMPLFRGDWLLTGTPKGVGEVKGGDKMTAWLSVDGKVLEESKIEVDCVWRKDGYGSEKKAVADEGC